MRVLHLSWEFPPYTVGGLGVHVDNLTKGLSSNNVDTTIWSRLENTEDSYIKKARLSSQRKTYYVRPDEINIPFHNNLLSWCFSFCFTLVREIIAETTQPPEIIHAHDWIVGQAAVTLSELWNIPLVTTIHATEIGRHHGNLATDLSKNIHNCENWLFSKSDYVIVCNEYMKDFCSTFFNLPELAVIPNGVDRSLWKEQKKCLINYDFVYFGRLEYEKGVHILLDALALLSQQQATYTLAIIGSGTQDMRLREQVQNLGLSDKVTFLGHQNPQSASAVIASSTVVVLPSLHEPFGIVALEAAAVGAALLVPKPSGLSEFVDEEPINGRTFKLGDHHSLAATMHAMKIKNTDTERFIRNGITKIASNKYSWTSIASQTTDVYLTLLASAKSNRHTKKVILPRDWGAIHTQFFCAK